MTMTAKERTTAAMMRCEQAQSGLLDACMGTSVAGRTLDSMLAAASELAAQVGRAQRLFWFFRHGDVRGEQQLEAVAAHMDACAASAEAWLARLDAS